MQASFKVSHTSVQPEIVPVIVPLPFTDCGFSDVVDYLMNLVVLNHFYREPLPSEPSSHVMVMRCLCSGDVFTIYVTY